MKAPPLSLQFAVVGFLEVGNANQSAVIAVGPTVIGTGKGCGIAGICAAQAVTTVAADIQESLQFSRAVTPDQDRGFAHIGGEEVTRTGDLAFMAQKQPTTSEDALELLRVDLRLDENVAADEVVFGINQTAGTWRHPTLLWVLSCAVCETR